MHHHSPRMGQGGAPAPTTHAPAAPRTAKPEKDMDPVPGTEPQAGDAPGTAGQPAAPPDLEAIDIRGYPGGLDGIDLRALWERLVDEGLVRHVFHDGSVDSAGAFTAFAGEQGRAFYAVYADGDPAALFWLDARAGRSARIHFAVYRAFFGSAARVIGFYVTDWLLSVRGADGRRLIDVLIGATPRTNRAAVRLLRDLGFTVLGAIPHAAPLAGGASTGAVVSYITRKED